MSQVNPAKRSVRPLKSLSLGVNWYVYCSRSCIVLLSSGTLGNQMQALHVTPGNLHKITKFESEYSSLSVSNFIKWKIIASHVISVEATAAKPGKLAVFERDVALAVLYGTPCIIVLRHQPGVNRSLGTAFVCVYTVHKYVSHDIDVTCALLTLYSHS